MCSSAEIQKNYYRYQHTDQLINDARTYFTVIVTGEGRGKCVQVVTIPHLIAWPIASPEFNRVIVGAGAQYMPEWMPAETPHNAVMGRIDRADLLIRAGRIEIIIKGPFLFTLDRSHPTFQKRMDPSEPPEQKSPSCMGCHETALASFL